MAEFEEYKDAGAKGINRPIRTLDKDVPNGIAGLDENGDLNASLPPAILDNKADLVGGKVPAAQLPSYVDDVLEFANLGAFPVTGETGILYVALDTDFVYRWTGSVYVEISKGEVQATETVAGISEIATQTEVHDGTDDTRFITPLKLEAEKGIPDGIAGLDSNGRIPSANIQGGTTETYSFGDNNEPHVQANSNVWTPVANWIFDGTASVGNITSIGFNVWRSGGSQGEFRVVNKITGLIITGPIQVTTENVNNLVFAGSILNLPLGKGIFELQLRRVTAGTTVLCSSIIVYY